MGFSIVAILMAYICQSRNTMLIKLESFKRKLFSAFMTFATFECGPLCVISEREYFTRMDDHLMVLYQAREKCQISL